MGLLLLIGVLVLAPSCGPSEAGDLPDRPTPAHDVVDDDFDSGSEVNTDAGWPPPCDDVAYLCNEFASANPAPYESCSGLPFYRICSDLRCVPTEGELKVFHEAWLSAAPHLLGMTQKTFSSHVVLNRLSIEPALPDEKEYRADFLLVLDWVIVRKSHQARVPATSTVDQVLLSEALLSASLNRYNALPESVVSLADVQTFFRNLDLTADYCHISVNRPPQGTGLSIGGRRDDEVPGQCLLADFDLVVGNGECSLYSH